MLATLVAGIFGWAFAAVAAFYSIGLALIVLGAIVGTFVGTAQWLAVQPHWDILDGPSNNTISWPAVSAVASEVGWLVTAFAYIFLQFSGSDVITATAVGFATGGAVFGISQWLLLREHLKDAHVWIAMNIVACGVGAFLARWVIDLILEPFLKQFPSGAYMLHTREVVEIFIEGAVGMVPFALITGSTLVWIIRRDFFLRSSHAGSST